MPTGSEVIKSTLHDAPAFSGVYKMLDKTQRVIYVGKAKNLKKRLTNYIRSNLDTKTLTMLSFTCFVEYNITNSEVEALLLEAQLIKKFKPKYNILLKDDKSFPFIKLRMDHDYPQLLKFRGKDLTDGEFFGPFASIEHVDTTLNELQKIFKLRSCTDHYFITRKRPCLQYQIGRCYAPCVNKISKSDYDDLVQQVKQFLHGKNAALQKMLAQKMEDLSAGLRFEEAAEIRDRIKALSYIQLKAGLSGGIKDADLIVVVEKNGHYCIEVFLYRLSQACGHTAYFPVHTENSTKSEVLEYFLIQFYQTRQVPDKIILNHELENSATVKEALKLTSNNSKVNIIVPVHGENVKLVKNAEMNAELALKNHMQRATKNLDILREVQAFFNLPELPTRIEVYDNSHIMGKFAVGAMVVAGSAGFDRKEFRIFNIEQPSSSTVSGGDDYAMLKYVLTRRFMRLQQEPNKIPSLMIIDGGRGHMSVVLEIMKKFSLNIPFVCMSKGVERNAGREQFHLPQQVAVTIDKNLPLMKYLQILRDEAHNFAIKRHRVNRSKAIRVSALDGIMGIGVARKKALLHYFGSYDAIRDATIDELLKVPGISRSLAKTIRTITSGGE